MKDPLYRSKKRTIECATQIVFFRLLFDGYHRTLFAPPVGLQDFLAEAQ
jgi:hypothetical protein